MEAFQVVASSLFEHSGHITHALEGIKLLDFQPLFVFVVFHGLQELVAIIIPTSALKRGNLADIVTAYNVK